MPRSEGIETWQHLIKFFLVHSDPERMPRSEGIETNGLSRPICCVYGPERMPRSEGIETFTIKVITVFCVNARNECPDQRGLRHFQGTSVHLLQSHPERMPRSEGIETLFQ